MTTINITVYRTLEWTTEIDVEDASDLDAIHAAIQEVVPRQSSDFHTQIEEYADLEDGRRVDLLG